MTNQEALAAVKIATPDAQQATFAITGAISSLGLTVVMADGTEFMSSIIGSSGHKKLVDSVIAKIAAA